jgi:hypothetical protein
VKRAIPRSKMGSPTLNTSAHDGSSLMNKFSGHGADIRGRSKSEAPMPISSNTSTLAASMVNSSPANLSAQKKAAMSLSNSRPPSYAAALKSGSHATELFPQPPPGWMSSQSASMSSLLNSQPDFSSQMLSSGPGGVNSSVGDHSVFGQGSLSLFSQQNDAQFDAFMTNRTSRAFSEPIVRLDPLMDLSLFGARSGTNGLGGGDNVTGGAAWLESTNVNNGPPSPEAWTRLFNSLSVEKSNKSKDSSSGSATTTQQSQLSEPSQQGFYTMLNDEKSDSGSNSSTNWTRRHSDPLILPGFDLSETNQLTSSFGESLPMRARSASRDENGSLILGITQQARTSRANSITDMDLLPPLQSQPQRRMSNPHDLLDVSLSQLGDFGSRSRTTSASGDIWGNSIGLR